jgi:hypothetical protein
MEMKTSSQELADAILKAAKLREESFDHHAASRGDVVDACSLYRCTLYAASTADGCNPHLSIPVYLMLTGSWNDSLNWAEVNKSK